MNNASNLNQNRENGKTNFGIGDHLLQTGSDEDLVGVRQTTNPVNVITEMSLVVDRLANQ